MFTIKNKNKSLQQKISVLETQLNRYINELTLIKERYSMLVGSTENNHGYTHKVNRIANLVNQALLAKRRMVELSTITQIDIVNKTLLEELKLMTKSIAVYNRRAAKDVLVLQTDSIKAIEANVLVVKDELNKMIDGVKLYQSLTIEEDLKKLEQKVKEND